MRCKIPTLTPRRIFAASRGEPTPAKPKLWLWRAQATITAIIREVSEASIDVPLLKGRRLRTPTLGSTFLVTTYLTILVVLSLYGLDTSNRRVYNDIGNRTGYVTASQLPLIFLLAGKKNIIGWLTGTSYERINYLHRWAARGLLLTATLHLGYWIAEYIRYGGYVLRLLQGQGTVGPTFQTGFVAWIILLWITLSSFSPIRGLSYEVFVIQHFISFTAFIVVVYLHLFPENRKWVWITVALFFFDRVLRAGLLVYTNLSIFHSSKKSDGNTSLWACQAHFTAVSASTTKITIRNPPISWAAGQHVFLSCHSIVPLQSHPFTISSIPQDGKMEFFVAAKKGGTRRFFRHALRTSDPSQTTTSSPATSQSVTIEGPYGTIRPLRQFDSVILVAGSTGITFTSPLLRDIISACRSPKVQRRGLFSLPNGAVTRHIRFVWVIRSQSQIAWFGEQLSAALQDVEDVRKEGSALSLEVSIYVTCDTSISGHQKSDDRIASDVSASQAVSASLPSSVHPSVAVVTGRPHCRGIIRASLEQALGESAVVVCGPSSLVEDVRQSVVHLSDERAVHKGTGAQGIHLHTERFGH